MGLSISVSALMETPLLDAVDLQRINQALQARGLPLHQEPEALDHRECRQKSVDEEIREYGYFSFPYSFLHYLRRFAARLRVDPGWTPTPIEDPDEDPLYKGFIGEYFDTDTLEGSHLIAHSDYDGFYVPVDFARVIVAGRPTGILGSSQALFRELRSLGPHLGLEAEGAPSQKTMEDVAAAADEEAPFFREKLVWLALYESARLSILLRSSIIFH